MGDKVFVATHGQGHRLLVRNLGFPDSHEHLRPPLGEIWDELELPELPESCTCTNTSAQPPSGTAEPAGAGWIPWEPELPD